MKVKAKFKNDITKVRVLAKHPMETGRRINKETGEKIPAKYIQELTCEYDGKVVFVAQFGTAVSQNPYLAFSFEGGKKGYTLELRWNDNTGDVEKTEAKIK
ncbi:MAG: thiosulfate oxidation carrier complex protein SoxZ [Cycloclasticus sp. symbiont of Bathymodiolus heckerae]|nr:MAG: thiosulfate oxidation carrier complex protein SoxZ [Cycloclasticus sp. symbiont of Bathymodiolus heckerae]